MVENVAVGVKTDESERFLVFLKLKVVAALSKKPSFSAELVSAMPPSDRQLLKFLERNR